MLRREREGVGLQGRELARRSQELELVGLALPGIGHEQLPDAAFDPLAHRVAAAVPVVEGTHDADTGSVGRPDREGRAVHAFQRRRMGAQLLVEAEMIALGQEVDVELAQDRRETVGVVDVLDAGVGEKTQTVGEAALPAFDDALVEARVVGALEVGRHRVAVQHLHPPGRGMEDPHHEGRAVPTLHAEHRERVAVASLHHRSDGTTLRAPRPLVSRLRPSRFHHEAPEAARPR